MGGFESEYRKLIRKSVFFRDSIDDSNDDLFDGNYKWLCSNSNRHFFLPNMERMVSLSLFAVDVFSEANGLGSDQVATGGVY